MRLSISLLFAVRGGIGLSQTPVGTPELNNGRGTISANDLAKQVKRRLFRCQEPDGSPQPNDGASDFIVCDPTTSIQLWDELLRLKTCHGRRLVNLYSWHAT